MSSPYESHEDNLIPMMDSGCMLNHPNKDLICHKPNCLCGISDSLYRSVTSSNVQSSERKSFQTSDGTLIDHTNLSFVNKQRVR